jgi:hypothetical protein
MCRVELQFTYRSLGFTQVTTRHTTSVTPRISVLHCPYRKWLQHVERFPQLLLAQWHPPGQENPGVRLQSR